MLNTIDLLTAISAPVQTEIFRRLQAVETEHQVRILLAVESGSRAWGFASPDSDFDVRFIYVRPQSWYLTIDLEDRRDVIEYPIVDDIDLNGWDLRKALRLYAKSNPGFVEWIQSPIQYLDRNGFADRMRQLLPAVYSPARGIYHYVSMAKRTYAIHLRLDTVRLKKYFYALRPLLAARWIERHGTAPPLEFQVLLDMAADEPRLLADVQELLERKRGSAELATGAPYASLNEFIEKELERFTSKERDLSIAHSSLDTLNRVFVEALQIV